jgi:hypothetical protein
MPRGGAVLSLGVSSGSELKHSAQTLSHLGEREGGVP